MRYIGNKNKLLKEIDKLLILKELKQEGLIFCDLFAGTGTVANYFNGYYKIIANDFLDYAYYLSAGLIQNKNVNFRKLGFNPFDYFNSYNSENYIKGFCYNNFCFDNNDGKVVLHFKDKADRESFLKTINSNCRFNDSQ